MEKYLFKKEFPGRYCLIEDNTDEHITRKYCVDYPSVNDDDDLNWSFFLLEMYGTCADVRDWNISKDKQEEIKNYIRIVLKPDDYNEYDFINDIRGRVRVKSIEIDGGYEDYYVDYPCKEEGIDNWKFYIGKDNKSTNGEFVTEPWIISDLEADYLKDYIRNKLKPINLCESEEKEMENTILNVSVPSDLAEEVMSIISRYEGVPVESSLQNVTDEFEQTKALTVSEYYRLKNVMIDKTKELEQCEEDKKIVLDERNNTRLKAKNCINDIFKYLKNEEQNEILEALIANMSDDVISCFDLESWREKIYDVVEIEVEMTKRKTIKVVVPHESYSECTIDDYIKQNCSGLEDTFDYEREEYGFGCHNSYDSGLTSKQICQKYGLSELFPGTSDIEDEVF